MTVVTATPGCGAVLMTASGRAEEDLVSAGTHHLVVHKADAPAVYTSQWRGVLCGTSAAARQSNMERGVVGPTTVTVTAPPAGR